VPGPRWYLRDPAAVALARGGELIIVPPGAAPVELADVDVEALAGVLAACATPVPGEALAELIEEESLALLVECGALLAGEEAELRARLPARRRRQGPAICRRVVVGVSGAVGALAAVDQVLALAEEVADEVDVILTGGARRFLRRQVFEYHGLRTWTDAFAPEHGAGVPHIHLASRADLVLIAPASAATLHRLASGACSDLLSLVVAATRAPVVIAPAMNGAMWSHPAVARNVAQLRADGMWVVEPRAGFEIADRDAEAALGAIGLGIADLARVIALVLERGGR